MLKNKLPEVNEFRKSKRINLLVGKEICGNKKVQVKVQESKTKHVFNDFVSFNLFSILKIEEAFEEETGKYKCQGFNTPEKNEDEKKKGREKCRKDKS